MWWQLNGSAPKNGEDTREGEHQANYFGNGKSIVFKKEMCSESDPEGMSVKKDDRPRSGGESQTPVDEQKFYAKETANNHPVDSVFFLEGQNETIETGV